MLRSYLKYQRGKANKSNRHTDKSRKGDIVPERKKKEEEWGKGKGRKMWRKSILSRCFLRAIDFRQCVTQFNHPTLISDSFQ